MVRELQHRTRNLLAVVQAISSRTRDSSTTLEEYATKFDRRLGSLSRVQDFLSREDGEVIELGEILRLELEALVPFDHHRVSVEGTRVSMTRQSIQLVALAFHELITNSLKYGALSGSDGTVRILWNVMDSEAGDRIVRIAWHENGLKERASASPKRGFGRTLIERALPQQLMARTHYELGTETLDCVVELPLPTESKNSG